MSSLEHLLSPITIKGTQFPNRVVIPPMGTGLCAPGGLVNDALLAYSKRQAQSGAGLFISEITAIHPNGAVSPMEVGAYDDKFIPGLKKLAEAMHTGGGKAAMQLHHGGRESFYMLKKGRAIGPSASPSLIYGQPPKEMTLDDIDEIVAAFGSAAARAREAGFDAVEIHGAHGYLLTQFLSAISNQRTDQYGGDFANRARFVIDVVRSVRESVGDDFPILLRISAEEFIKNGYSVDDVVSILPELMAAGTDVLHASIGTHGSPGSITSASPMQATGFNVWRAKKLKNAAQAPVIAVGRFNDPGPADDVIKNGEADFVAFGRQQLCDPDFLEKARQNRSQDIRVCIACNQGCIEREMFESKSVRCAINPETGQELIYPKVEAKTARKVMIVGAGPAGLTAAYEAKRLGHEVSLYEKEKVPGGNLLFACKAPHKEIYGDWIQWLITQVEKIGVEIKTGQTVTAETIDKMAPDAVILAAGGDKIIPALDGIDQPLVCDAWQILGETIAPGKNVVVVGGGLIGMETATFLGARGSQVTLIEQLPNSPVPNFTSHGYAVHKQLRNDGCQFRFGSALKKINQNSVVIAGNDAEETIEGIDQVVLAVGMKPRNELEAHLKQSGIRYFVVGDALQVRRIMEATEEGAQAIWAL
jgi:2,4-dienoyl-CoA reductase-like NADH-dependent reductase (Old Yellow Enzyme family)/thioredoxin reductase